MSRSSITKKTSSSRTFKTLATKVKTKLETKLEKVKCRLHKTKAANHTTSAIAEPNSAAPEAVMPEAVVPEAVVPEAVVPEAAAPEAVESKAADDEIQVITEPKADNAITEPKADNVITEPKADNAITEPKADNVLAEFKAAVANMPKPANYNTKIINEATCSDKDDHEAVAAIAPEDPSEHGHNRCDTNNEQQKPAKKQARREARKAKWAARRTMFKRNAKKVGDAVLLSAVVVGGIVFAPVILAVSIVYAVVQSLIWLVVKILDLLCCGPILACLLCKWGMEEPQALL